ncbi:MAG TPA: NAD-dependent epimerase/dehydratase family protein [Candidatus Saccharimonadales bacterium]|nr:NAD-dependent epimerase/dehydratase family protein [Candidatus Saccharimonadales bacterium]
MSRIVIFGANGFIGRNLTENLAKNKQDEIIAFDRFSDYQRDSGHPFDAHSNVRVVAGDFLNRNDVSAVLEKNDYVFHLVSGTNPATSNDDPFIDIEINVKASVELFEVCAKRKVQKVIFLSSGGTVYGDINSNKINELTLPAPRSPYAISKLTIEHYLRYFKYVSQLDYIVYRVANPYGPGQNIQGKQGVIPIFMHQVLAGEPLTVYGDGSMVRDYIYISDLITMIVGSYKKANLYNEYNVGSGGKGDSVNEIIALVEKCAGKKIAKTHLPTPSTFVHKSVLDTTRFRKEFGISPEVTLEDGIERTWDYVKAIS